MGETAPLVGAKVARSRVRGAWLLVCTVLAFAVMATMQTGFTAPMGAEKAALVWTVQTGKQTQAELESQMIADTAPVGAEEVEVVQKGADFSAEAAAPEAVATEDPAAATDYSAEAASAEAPASEAPAAEEYTEEADEAPAAEAPAAAAATEEYTEDAEATEAPAAEAPAAAAAATEENKEDAAEVSAAEAPVAEAPAAEAPAAEAPAADAPAAAAATEEYTEDAAEAPAAEAPAAAAATEEYTVDVEATEAPAAEAPAAAAATEENTADAVVTEAPAAAAATDDATEAPDAVTDYTEAPSAASTDDTAEAAPATEFTAAAAASAEAPAAAAASATDEYTEDEGSTEAPAPAAAAAATEDYTEDAAVEPAAPAVASAYSAEEDSAEAPAAATDEGAEAPAATAPAAAAAPAAAPAAAAEVDEYGDEVAAAPAPEPATVSSVLEDFGGIADFASAKVAVENMKVGYLGIADASVPAQKKALETIKAEVVRVAAIPSSKSSQAALDKLKADMVVADADKLEVKRQSMRIMGQDTASLPAASPATTVKEFPTKADMDQMPLESLYEGLAFMGVSATDVATIKASSQPRISAAAAVSRLMHDVREEAISRHDRIQNEVVAKQAEVDTLISQNVDGKPVAAETALVSMINAFATVEHARKALSEVASDFESTDFEKNTDLHDRTIAYQQAVTALADSTAATPAIATELRAAAASVAPEIQSAADAAAAAQVSMPVATPTATSAAPQHVAAPRPNLAQHLAKAHETEVAHLVEGGMSQNQAQNKQDKERAALFAAPPAAVAAPAAIAAAGLAAPAVEANAVPTASPGADHTVTDLSEAAVNAALQAADGDSLQAKLEKARVKIAEAKAAGNLDRATSLQKGMVNLQEGAATAPAAAAAAGAAAEAPVDTDPQNLRASNVRAHLEKARPDADVLKAQIQVAKDRIAKAAASGNSQRAASLGYGLKNLEAAQDVFGEKPAGAAAAVEEPVEEAVEEPVEEAVEEPVEDVEEAVEAPVAATAKPATAKMKKVKKVTKTKATKAPEEIYDEEEEAAVEEEAAEEEEEEVAAVSAGPSQISEIKETMQAIKQAKTHSSGPTGSNMALQSLKTKLKALKGALPAGVGIHQSNGHVVHSPIAAGAPEEEPSAQSVLTKAERKALLEVVASLDSHEVSLKGLKAKNREELKKAVTDLGGDVARLEGVAGISQEDAAVTELGKEGEDRAVVSQRNEWVFSHVKAVLKLDEMRLNDVAFGTPAEDTEELRAVQSHLQYLHQQIAKYLKTL